MNPQEQSLKNAFPTICNNAVAEICSKSQYIEAPEGSEIFNVGDRCENFFLVLGGSICVQLVSATNRKIILYRVEAGDTCVLTTACLIGGLNYNAEAVAEADVTAIAIPHGDFQRIFETHQSFQQLVFALFGARLTDIVGVLEGVAFKGIDARLAGFLLSANENGAVKNITHVEIAANIGTAREVVSRHLKAFSAKSYIAHTGGAIMLQDIETLQKISTGQ